MVEIEESVHVALPLEDVFEFAARPENMPLWNPVVRESTLVGQLRRGATVVQSVELAGRRFQATYEVSEYRRPRRVGYRAVAGPVQVAGTMSFHREPGGTRVVWVVRGDCRGVLRVAQGMLVRAGRPEMRVCLRNLKRALEEGTAQTDRPLLEQVEARASSLVWGGHRRLMALASSVIGPAADTF